MSNASKSGYAIKLIINLKHVIFCVVLHSGGNRRTRGETPPLDWGPQPSKYCFSLGYSEAGLRLCFRIMQIVGFLMQGLICDILEKWEDKQTKYDKLMSHISKYQGMP